MDYQHSSMIQRLCDSQSMEQAEVGISRYLMLSRIPIISSRNINSPYQGTLSSYGYVLLVIYFLIHVKNPPVLPNLQQMPPLRPISQVCRFRLTYSSDIDQFQEDTHIGGHNTWSVLLAFIASEASLTPRCRFFDDIELLRQRWQSSNTDSVADL